VGKLELIRALYDYNEWANNRLLKTASELSSDEFSRSQGASWGSVEANLAHIAGAQVVWLSRWQTGANPVPLADTHAVTGLDSIYARFDESHAALRRFTASLTDDRLDSLLAFTDSRGDSYEQVLWQLMTHVANHGTYHRGEVAMALTALGHSPGDLDYRYFEIERAGRTG
jgi:uncharacterized damage-inducible protein DinB